MDGGEPLWERRAPGRANGAAPGHGAARRGTRAHHVMNTENAKCCGGIASPEQTCVLPTSGTARFIHSDVPHKHPRGAGSDPADEDAEGGHGSPGMSPGAEGARTARDPDAARPRCPDPVSRSISA